MRSKIPQYPESRKGNRPELLLNSGLSIAFLLRLTDMKKLISSSVYSFSPDLPALLAAAHLSYKYSKNTARGLRLSSGLLRTAILGGLLFSAVCSAACSGGSESSGDSSSGLGLNSARRSKNTGIRVFHTGLDVEPVDLKIGERYVNKAAFMQLNYFEDVPTGPQTLTIERANTPGEIIFSQDFNFEPKTEYTAFLFGRNLKRNFQVKLLPEPVIRPAKGEGRIRFVNGLDDSKPLEFISGGLNSGPLFFGSASEFFTVSSGALNIQVKNTNGDLLGNLSEVLVDQGELTIVAGGSASLGVNLLRAYSDLD